MRDRNAPDQSEGGSRPQDTAPERSQPSEASGITKRPPGEAQPETTTAAAPNQAPPTAPEAPRSHGESSQNPHPANTRPDSTPPSDAPSSPESRQQSPTAPSIRPSTPPLSVPQSQRLLDNVAKMHPKAQQHPQVQADVAQAREVVAAEAQSRNALPALEASKHSADLPKNIDQSSFASTSEIPGARGKTEWDQRFQSWQKSSPVKAPDVIAWKPSYSSAPELQQKMITGAQGFFDLLPPEVVKSLGKVNVEVAASLRKGGGRNIFLVGIRLSSHICKWAATTNSR